MGVFEVTIVVASANAGLAAIADKIGIQPTFGYDKGEPVSSRNPAAGIRQHARWDLTFRDVGEVGFGSVVLALDAIARVREPDWDVSMALMVDASTEKSTSVGVPSEAVQSLGRACGSILIDAFAYEA